MGVAVGTVRGCVSCVVAVEMVGGAAGGGTWREETGILNVWTMSGDCWTGEVAVWAVFCFSLLRHFALRFWNQT